MPTIQIELTQDEARVLLNMINSAVMALGLEAAEAGLYFKRKIDEAMAIPPVPVEPPTAPQNDFA